MTTLKERLRELRGPRSQAEFARFVGIPSQQTYQRYEDGKTMPNAEMLHRIASACDVSVDWLIGSSDKKKIKFGGKDDEYKEQRDVLLSALLTLQLVEGDASDVERLAELCYEHHNVEGLKLIIENLLLRLKSRKDQP
jgi:transcriptional regulator with XRE-family HTH domain